MGESAYNSLLPQVAQRLSDLGLLTNSDGADVVFPEGFTNRENQPLPLIIRKLTVVITTRRATSRV